MPTLNPDRTALVLIDLQHGIVGQDLAPRTGTQVVDAAKNLAARFREARAPVFLVHVGWRADGADLPSQEVDDKLLSRMDDMPRGWSDLVSGLREEGDVVVLKRHWGAFTGTDLDLQLRRRGIDTIVLGGIATNYGVESTARSAGELSYNVVFVEDVATSRSADLHDFAVKNVFPQISRVCASEDVALGRD